jgi:hypothetical protein
LKFRTLNDKYLFLSDIGRSDLFEDVNEEYVPPKELVELFFKKEKGLFQRLKDRRRQKRMESEWRHNRYIYQKGSKKFQSSSYGKRFHTELGKFLSTHDMTKGGLVKTKDGYSESMRYIVPINSLVTHYLIESDFYKPLVERVDLHFTCLDIMKLRERMENYFLLGDELDEQDYEFLVSLVEVNAILNAFATQSGKSKEHVEKVWGKVKASLLKSGKQESDSNFYQLLVGGVKKSLKIKKKKKSP